MNTSSRRLQPPVASPIDTPSLLHGLLGLFHPECYSSRLDDELKTHFGVRYVFKVSSGKAGLVLILRAMKRLAPFRDEVVLPAYTCYSVPSAIVSAGLKPVPCDVDAATFDYSFDRLPTLLSSRTLCVISCDLFGLASDVDGLRDICIDKNIFIVDDAAQAMGVESDGLQLGTRGDAGLFSLGRGKCVSAGSGGIVITNSDLIGIELAKEYQTVEEQGLLESIRDLLLVLVQSLFIHPSCFWIPAGIPQLRIGETLFYPSISVKRFSGMSAGLMRHWKKRLEVSRAVRRNSGRIYEERLGCSLPSRRSVPYLRFPHLMATPSEKDALIADPRARALGISPMYPTSIDLVPDLQDIAIPQSCPVAQSIAKRLVTLPTHQYLCYEDINKICELLSRRVD